MSEEYSYPAARVQDPESAQDLGFAPPAPATPAAQRETPQKGGGAGAMAKLARTRKKEPAQPKVASPERPPVREGARRRGPRTKASTARLPIDLIEDLRAESRRTDVSLGGVMVLAIEKHFDDLPRLLGVRPKSGAGFSAAVATPQNKQKVETKVLSFRLSHDDFETLERVASDVGARSVSQLITTALTAYFQDGRHAEDT